MTTTKQTRFSKVGTKLSPDQVKARAVKFGLTAEQIAKLDFHIFQGNPEISVMVYPGHKDTDALTDFLTDDLIRTGDAFPNLG